MSPTKRWPREAWVPLLAGILWLWGAPTHGLVGFIFSIVPGCLLLGSGVSMLLMAGDRRISQFAALGGLLGVVFALPAFVVVGPGHALLLIAASVGSFLAAGAHTLRLELPIEEVPDPEPSLALAAQVAVDEALLAGILATAPLPGVADHERGQREVAAARELFEAQGWLEKPADYHVTPPDLEMPEIRTRRARGVDFEHLCFESGYEPRPDEPGRERWLGFQANRTAHAWVLRHSGPPRPWLVCLHGYQMGWPAIDLLVFRPEIFHRRLGLNLIVPVLPLHGRRKVGRQSGHGLFGDVMDGIHAEAQAMWDIRQLLGWVRAQGEPKIGVLGYSLGGYNAALLASLDAELACAIAGVPMTDFARAVYRHAPPLVLREAERRGLPEERMREVKQVISPLVIPPRIPKEARYIFGAVGDRLVTPDQVRDLWRHWDRPRIVWYQGGHVSFRAHPQVQRFVYDALRESGVTY